MKKKRIKCEFSVGGKEENEVGKKEGKNKQVEGETKRKK